MYAARCGGLVPAQRQYAALRHLTGLAPPLTTLLQALLGRLPLAHGTRQLGRSVVVGEMDQARRRFTLETPVLDTFIAATELRVADARSTLAKFGLMTDHVLRPAKTLSPGERTRAVLALFAARGVNCLVLDEPTNHLDLPAIDQLEQALDAYEGTLLLVTHDRRLLDAVRITRTVAVTAGTVRTGTQRASVGALDHERGRERE